MQAIRSALSPGMSRNSLAIQTAYATTCAITAGTCEAIGAASTFGATVVTALINTATELPMCYLSSYISGFVYNTEMATTTKAASIPILGGILESGYTWTEKIAEYRAIKSKGLIGKVSRLFTPSAYRIFDIAGRIGKQGDSISYGKAIEEILEIVKGPTKSHAVDWGKLTYADILGVDGKKVTVKDLAKAISEKSAGAYPESKIVGILETPVGKAVDDTTLKDIIGIIEEGAKSGDDKYAKVLKTTIENVKNNEEYAERLLNKTGRPMKCEKR